MKQCEQKTGRKPGPKVDIGPKLLVVDSLRLLPSVASAPVSHDVEEH